MKIIQDAIMTFTAKAKQTAVDDWKKMLADGKIEKAELTEKLSQMKAAVVAEIMGYLRKLGIDLAKDEVETRVEAAVRSMHDVTPT